MGYDDNTDKWDRRAEKWDDDFANKPGRTAAKVFFWILGITIAGSILFGAINFIGDWGDAGKKVISPDNVTEQNFQIIQDWESMQAAVGNVCDSKSSKSNSRDPVLVEDTTLAYKATYRRIAVDYNRRMENLYEARMVRNLPIPSDLKRYPRTAPTVEQAIEETCPGD